MLRLYLLCLAFFVDESGVWMGESYDYFVGNGARYRGLIYELIGEIKEATSPYGSRRFDE